MAALWEFRFSLPRPPAGGVVELSPEEVEKVLLRKLRDERGSPCQALWELAQFYKGEQRHEAAMAYLQKLLKLVNDVEGRASCLLTMGQVREQSGDFRAALRHYKEALACEPASDATWYLIHNNLGFCFAALGRFEDAERYCRQAIRIDSGRPNAHKNLGLALRAQGRLTEAAEAFINGTRANASDPRASQLLAKLLEDHPELKARFAEEASYCRKAVQTAEREGLKRKPAIHRGWRKKLFLLRVRLHSLWKRFFAVKRTN